MAARKRGYVLDTIVAFASACALTFIYISLVTASQKQPSLRSDKRRGFPPGSVAPFAALNH